MDKLGLEGAEEVVNGVLDQRAWVKDQYHKLTTLLDAADKFLTSR